MIYNQNYFGINLKIRKKKIKTKPTYKYNQTKTIRNIQKHTKKMRKKKTNY